MHSLRNSTRRYASKLNHLCSKLGNSVPQSIARTNASEIVSVRDELEQLKSYSSKKIKELNERVVLLLDQVDQERKLRQSAEESMKLSQSNLLREKEERSIVELSMKDTIKRLRFELHGLKVKVSNSDGKYSGPAKEVMSAPLCLPRLNCEQRYRVPL